MSVASAPASTANLGPGFDCLAVAFDLRCTVEVAAAPAWSVQSGGTAVEGRAAETVIAAAARGAPDMELAVSIESDIPISRGLGSSAALRAAALLAAARAAGRSPGPADVFAATAELEGHGEQAAAAVYGGAVAVNAGRVTRLEVHEEVRFLIAVPDVEVSTPAARNVLPQAVSHGAAAGNIARTVFLVEGLRRGDRRLLGAAAGDELHEPYRADLAPRTAELMAAARHAGAWHTALSGAGSAVIALASTAETEEITAAWRSLEVGVLTPAVAASGLR